MQVFHSYYSPRLQLNREVPMIAKVVRTHQRVALMSIALKRNGSVAMLWPRYCGRNANITTRPFPCLTSTIAPLLASFSAPRSQPDNRSSLASEKRAITLALSSVGSNAILPSTQAMLSSLEDSSIGAPRVIGLAVSTLILSIEPGQ